MAEQINIQIITNSLRNFAKAWAEANRQAQLNKERRKRLEAEAKRLRKLVEQAKPWPGAVPETERQEELAAFRGDKPGIAVAFVDIGLDGAPLDYRVYSGLQNASTTGTRVELLFMGPKQFIEGGPAGTPLYGWFTRQIAGTIDETFLLPINGEDCILVTWQREQRLTEETRYKNVVSGGDVLLTLDFTTASAETVVESIACFVVGRKKVREVSVPVAFKAALDAACPLGVYVPPPEPDPYDNSNALPSGAYAWPSGPPFQPSLHFAVRLRLEGWLPGLTSDAGIYKCLSDWDNAPRVGYAGTTVLNLRSLLLAFLGTEPVPDQSFGYGKLAGTVTAERIGYDRNTNPDVFPSVWNRYPKTDIATVFNGTSVPVGLYSTWDWGEPRYCRQQLLALGFTTADLRS